MLLISCLLIIFLNGLLNRTKHNASSKVDFPAPLDPRIKCEGASSILTSVKELPVDRKFFHLISSKTIINYEGRNNELKKRLLQLKQQQQ